jgi:hypothetical protein
MKHLSLLAIALWSITAAADNKHAAPRPAAAPHPAKDAGARSVGIHITEHPDRPMHVKDNPPHTVTIHDPKTNKDEHHAVIIEHRPAHVIDHDPRIRIVARGYKPQHDWVRFHRAHGAWFKLWGVGTWDTVGTVTCEAANEATGELYPVSQDRDSRAWDDDSVNTILDQALDDCNADSGGAMCGPVTPACSFQPY